MPCCGASVLFTSLQFDRPAGFAHFELSIWNPNIEGGLPSTQSSSAGSKRYSAASSPRYGRTIQEGACPTMRIRASCPRMRERGLAIGSGS